MFKKLYFLMGLCLLFGMVVSPVVFTLGPIIEGRLLPVVKDTQIVTVSPEGLFKSRIWGSSHKIRERCQFKRLEWLYAPEQGTPVTAPVSFLAGTKSRGEGIFDFGPWVVDIADDKIKDESLVYAYHQCHPFWLTETQFYP